MMLSRLLLFPALLLLSLTACDGAFQIKGGDTPGDPFDAADFNLSDAARSDLASVEQTCAQYCDLQDTCDAWEAADCYDDCVSPKLDASFAVAGEAQQENGCGLEFVQANDCIASADCDSFAACDEILDDYVSCSIAAG